MAELPTGAVTFLFTDIEGSTQLVKQLRDRYGEVLAEHQRLLREAFVAHNGHEVDTQGDSFFVAFSSARDALLAAVEGQLALLAHDWPDGVQVKVRMGLHTGQAAAHGGRYTGLAVHRAARIGAAGHGGQILVSQATQTLLEDEEEDLHVFLRDLGEQRLKDLDRPVRLYQAAADGLPASFPPIRREADLAQAAEAAIAAPLWRRPAVLAAAAIALIAVVATAALLATRDSGGGLDGVQPNHVGVIDTRTNELVAEIPAGIRPGPVAVGAGAAWVGNLDDRTLTKIDLAARSVAGTISLEQRTPTGIAVGLGAVWVAHGVRGELSRVDPQFGRVLGTTPVGGAAAFGSSSGSVALGGGSVWAVFGDSTLARLNAAGGVRERTLAGSQPVELVFADGSVWVTNSADATVQRFNTRSFRQGALATFNVGRRPAGIAYVDGAIWVASSGDDVVTRIDPASGATLGIRVGDGPTAVAGSTDAVWVANTAAGTVSRIDAATNEVVATIAIRSAPSGLAAEGDFLWVTAQAS
jgi:YVTN family beta-propeller protein